MPFLLIIPNGRHWCSLLESRYPWILFNHFTDFSLSIKKLHYRKTSDITGDSTGDIQGLGKVDKVYLDNPTTIPKYTFEVGGKKKKQKQIQDAAQGYVVKDDIETGYGNIIPLWQFGLTY